MPTMHRNTFCGRAPPGPAGGPYVLPQDLLATMSGPTSKGREGKGLLIRAEESPKVYRWEE